MKHPADKFAQLQVAMLGLAIILGIVSFIRDANIYILLMFYALTFSLVFDGMAQMNRPKGNMFVLQFIRAILLFLFITILYF